MSKYMNTIKGVAIILVTCGVLSLVITKSQPDEIKCYNNSFLSLVKQPAVKSVGIKFYGGAEKVYKTSDSLEETGYNDITIPNIAKVCVCEVEVVGVKTNLVYATWKGEDNVLRSKFINTGEFY